MTKKELPKAYNPADYEDAIYNKWEKSGFFNPDNLNGEPYSIMMPPPNVTGVLHLGHALENSLMDIMARYQRMNGKKVLLLAGTDHAALPTQAKVEKLLWEKGIKNPRQELGREKLVAEIRKFAEESKATILSQVRKMGTSCDWSRLAYTFDEARNLAVNTVFTKMYNDGLIYRGERIINWDAKLQTTISDDEIIWQEETVPFYYLQYGPFTIATARPETKFGDKYVVMHPDDERYKKYKHGDKFEAEWINGPVTATVIKDEVIDPKFGTGVMTITPWHDMTDFDIAQRHKLSGEQIIDFSGKLMPIAGEFADMDILAARPKIVEKLKAKGLVVKVEENYLHRVAKGDRSNGLVEPQIKKQWFVDVNKKISKKNKSLKELMREAVTIGHNGDGDEKVKITPERFEKVYLNWIDNLRDWCISRQIWWGHRIPVWYKAEEIYVGVEAPKGDGWKQDEDTLDTWFSSGLWTFSTLGWPGKTPLAPPAYRTGRLDKGDSNDLKTFHPTSWMQMGYEILFFWMARMILMSTYALDEIPFKDVYIHGILRDESGKKFSKSAGNSVDPLEVIKQYGTDALRYAVIAGIAPGNDSRFYEEKVEGARNLVNKLWNISRYILGKTGNSKNNSDIDFNKLTLANKYILAELEGSIKQVTEYLENYAFSSAGEWLRIFTWDHLADWYLEATKFQNDTETEKVLLHVLRVLLKLWHPFIPFVTEVIWNEFNDSDLMMEKWPKTKFKGKEMANLMTSAGGFLVLKEIIVKIRNARAENNVDNSKKITAVFIPGEYEALIEYNQQLIKGLRTGIEKIEFDMSGEKYKNEISIVISNIANDANSNIEIYLLGAVDAGKEKARLEKEIANLEKLIKTLSGKLTNKEFIDKAPETIVKKEKDKLSGWQTEMEKMEKQLKNL